MEGKKMKEISKAEFDACGVGRGSGVENTFTEKRWFCHAQLLGVIVFDSDCQWGWVTLAKHKDDLYRGVDLGHSITTQHEAIAELSKSLQINEHIVEVNGGPPCSLDRAAEILEAVSGIPKQHALAGVEALKKPSRRGRA